MTVDLDHLWPPFHSAVSSILASDEGRSLGLYVVSGFRSVALQQQLFDAAVKKYGSAAAASKWVAPPGHSNHGPKVDDHGHEPGQWGRAVDLGMPGTIAVSGKWPPDKKRRVDALAARFGLRSPMSWEDWHYEPGPNFVVPNSVATKEQAMNRIIEPVSSVPFPGKAGSGWVFGRRGHVYAFGGAPFLGGAPDDGHDDDFVALIPTAAGDGYWLVRSSGLIYAYGAAKWPGNYDQAWGSTNDLPIVGGFANSRAGVDLIRIDIDLYSLPTG